MAANPERQKQLYEVLISFLTYKASSKIKAISCSKNSLDMILRGFHVHKNTTTGSVSYTALDMTLTTRIRRAFSHTRWIYSL